MLWAAGKVRGLVLVHCEVVPSLPEGTEQRHTAPALKSDVTLSSICPCHSTHTESNANEWGDKVRTGSRSAGGLAGGLALVWKSHMEVGGRCTAGQPARSPPNSTVVYVAIVHNIHTGRFA